MRGVKSKPALGGQFYTVSDTGAGIHLHEDFPSGAVG